MLNANQSSLKKVGRKQKKVIQELKQYSLMKKYLIIFEKNIFEERYIRMSIFQETGT